MNKLDGFKQIHGWLPPIFVGEKAANNVEDKSQEQQLDNVGNSIDIEKAFKKLTDIELDVVKHHGGFNSPNSMTFHEIDEWFDFDRGVSEKVHQRAIKKLRKFFNAEK